MGPVLVAVLAVAASLSAQSHQTTGDPFAFFAPAVTVSAADLRALDQGGSLARVLTARDRQVAVFAAVPVNITGDRLAAWMRRMPELKKSEHVLAIGLLSTPPRVEDLRDLTLDEGDLQGIRHCKPGSCSVKLSAREIATLQSAVTGKEIDWRPRLQDAFRELVIARAKAYLAGGQKALDPNVDQGKPAELAATFSAILRRSDTLLLRMPQFCTYLENYPTVAFPGVESFLYWSKEHIGGKTQVNLTQVAMVRPASPDLPEVVVAAKQVFTTHYLNASLGLTVLLRSADSSRHYLAYLNRSETDVLGGFFGGLVRLVVERRLKSEAPAILRALRTRLESGEPGSPGEPASGK